MMQEKEATIQSQQQELATLREELDALKRAVLKLTDGGGPLALKTAC